MKTLRFPRLFLFSLCLVGLLAGCGESGESWKQVQEKGGETWDALKTWSAEKSAEARAAFTKKMAELKPQLEVARVAAQKAGAQTSKELEAAVQAAEVGLKDLKGATAETWKDLFATFQVAWEALQKMIQDLGA
jgi:uncharacterized lipoprotein YehR (DUF1307 family)